MGKKPIIEPTFRFRRYRPDLVVLEKGELPCLNELIPQYWIECKKVKVKKLVTLGRYLSSCQIIWFHITEILNQITIKSLQKEKYKLPVNVQLIGIQIFASNWKCLQENIVKKQQRLDVIQLAQNNILISLGDQQENQVELKFDRLI